MRCTVTPLPSVPSLVPPGGCDTHHVAAPRPPVCQQAGRARGTTDVRRIQIGNEEEAQTLPPVDIDHDDRPRTTRCAAMAPATELAAVTDGSARFRRGRRHDEAPVDPDRHPAVVRALGSGPSRAQSAPGAPQADGAGQSVGSSGVCKNHRVGATRQRDSRPGRTRVRHVEPNVATLSIGRSFGVA